MSGIVGSAISKSGIVANVGSHWNRVGELGYFVVGKERDRESKIRRNVRETY